MNFDYNFLLELLKKPIVGKISSAMVSQSMLSLTNFVLAFVVAKYGTKQEYAIYVILLSIVGIVGNYQDALVNTPLTVLAPRKGSHEKASFISGLAFGQWLLFMPLIALSIIVVSVYSLAHQDFSMLKYVLVLSLAVWTYLLREFLRTVSYSKLRMHLVIKMDAVFVLLIGVGIWILIVLREVTCNWSIIILGIGYLAASVFGYFSAADAYSLKWEAIESAFKETWYYSRWALIGVTSDIFKNRAYIYVLSATLGLEKVAEISAARLFVMPVGLLVDSSGKIITAKGAEILNIKGMGKFKEFIFGMCLFLVFLWVSYVSGLWVFFDYLIEFLGEKYRNITGFVFLWGIFSFIYSLRYTITRALVVATDFKALAWYDVICGMITISGCLILTALLGGYGTILSLIVGELVSLLLTGKRFALQLRSSK